MPRRVEDLQQGLVEIGDTEMRCMPKMSAHDGVAPVLYDCT